MQNLLRGDHTPLDDGFYLHHGGPLPFGGDLPDAAFSPLPSPPPVDEQALRQPRTPGLPPLMHFPLPAPDALKLPLPQPDDDLSTPSPALFDSGQTAFPVAKPPAFRRLATTPSVPTDMPASDTEDNESTPAQQPASNTAAAPQQSFGQRLDPLFPFLLYLALGVGTLFMNLDPPLRYTVLWTALIALGTYFTIIDVDDTSRWLTSLNLGWGVSIGLVFTLPVLILFSAGLKDMSTILFPQMSRALLFQSLAFVAPLGETLFFRGAMQDRRGIVVSVIGAGLSGVLLFYPAAYYLPIYLVAAGLVTVVLAGIYSFIRSQYGLAAAYVCQVTVNLLLLFTPGLFVV